MQAQCKMCGAPIQLKDGQTVARCEYCGGDVTVPRTGDEHVISLYNRANELRIAQEFDKAQMMYENIVQEHPEDAEAHFNIALSRFGIQYVEDPVSGERKPTLHRMQFSSILADESFLKALDLADPIARKLYQKDGDLIDQIQKDYLKISNNEKPFDIFICYKEKDDETGDRTYDSVYAQEIYDALVREGYKVFFARVTLEHKLGEAYEPYIFAALNSAKVMLVVGTSEAHMQARWVRNEWKRFLYLAQNNPDKRIVPVYRDMDPEDMPEEFAYLQAQDYGKIGALQDLVRGVKKIVGEKRSRRDSTSSQQTAQESGGNVRSQLSALLRRAALFLEDGEFETAKQYYDRILDQDPECAEAYMGKAAIDLGLKKLSDLSRHAADITKNLNVSKALRFATDNQKETFEGWIKKSAHRQTYRKAAEAIGLTALKKDNAEDALVQRKQANDPSGYSAEDYTKAAALFEQVKSFADAQTCAYHCRSLAKTAEKHGEYAAVVDQYLSSTAPSLTQISDARKALEQIEGYEPAKEQLEKLNKQYDDALAHECTQIHNQIWRNTEYDAIRFDSYAQLIRALPQDDERVQKLYGELENCKRNLTGKWTSEGGKVPGSDISDSSFDKPTRSKKDVERECKRISKELKKEKTFVPVLLSQYRDRIAALPQDNPHVKALSAELERTHARLKKKSEKKKKHGFLHFLFFKLFIPAALIFSFIYFDGYRWLYQQLPRDIRKQAFVTQAFSALNTAQRELNTRIGTPNELTSNVRIWLYETTSEYLPQIADKFAPSAADQYTLGLRYRISGDYRAAVNAYEQAVGYSDALYRAYDIRSRYLFENKLAASAAHALVNAQNGSVTGMGTAKLTDVSDWKNVVAVAASESHSLGLTKDGTVNIVSKLFSVEDPTEKWTDIVAVAAGDYHTVGLKKDGTVVAAGLNTHRQCNVTTWKDVIAVEAGDLFTLGLTKDGNVLLAGSYSAISAAPSVTGWKNVADIAAGGTHVIAARRDGTVLCEGTNSVIVNKAKSWTDVVAVAAGKSHVVALKKDGTVVAAGSGDCCKVSSFKNVVSIVADANFTAVFFKDGTMDIVGEFDY